MAERAVSQELKPIYAAVEKYAAKTTASKKAAIKALKRAGILDSKGRLKKRYQS